MRMRQVGRLLGWSGALWGFALCGTAGCGSSAGQAGQNDAGDTLGDATSDPAGSNGLSLVSAAVFTEDAHPVVGELPIVEDELLVQPFPGAEPADLQAVYRDAGAVAVEEFPDLNTTVLRVNPAQLEETGLALGSSPLIEGVQKSYLYSTTRTPNDPQYASQPYLGAIGLPAAWDVTTGTASVIIAVVDTGVDGRHPDLSAHLVAGWNVYDDNAITADVSGHGTAVASVIAAVTNNSAGLAGVCWDSSIMPVRVSNSSARASSRSVAAGLMWAVDHTAKVINVSFAPLSADRTVLRAAEYVRNSGGLVLVSAGNEGVALSDADSPAAIFVGAVSATSALAGFSNKGPFVDLVAPGTNILAASPGGTYVTMNGTSFASPIAAGVAALLWSVREELRPATIESILFGSVRDLGASGRDDSFGAGMVQADAAVHAAMDMQEIEDSTPPRLQISQPRQGARVSGVIQPSVAASDAQGVADVVLYLDGQPFATDSSSPYRFALNTTTLSVGVHTLAFVATDRTGNSSAPAQVSVTVEQSGVTTPTADRVKPAVTINFPVTGTVVSASVGIQATATDNVGLTGIEWLVDGAQKQWAPVSGTRVTHTFVWDAARVSAGEHTITARAMDQARNQGTATIRLVKR